MLSCSRRDCLFGVGKNLLKSIHCLHTMIIEILFALFIAVFEALY
jgi:hypothetical protein